MWWPAWPNLSWKRTSLSILAACEQSILSCLTTASEGMYVPIYDGTKRIWTLSLNTKAPGTPLVLLHGMGSGVALWVVNLDSLARSRPVYAIDMLGFGRSSRCKFSKDPLMAEREFVESIEEWRKTMKLDTMILLGHSLGGYIATSYALHYSQHIKHLVLADPWGLPQRPLSLDTTRTLPLWAKVVRRLIEPFNPFAVLRFAGPWGPSLVTSFRADLLKKYEHLFDDSRIGDYLYHCNAQYPSGEKAFKNMTYEFGWARHPMIDRVKDIPSNVSMTLIYGSRSWVDYGVGYEVKYRRADSYVGVEVIREAGHHVYADKSEVFNALVNRTCDMVERHVDVLKPQSPRPQFKRDSQSASSQSWNFYPNKQPKENNTSDVLSQDDIESGKDEEEMEQSQKEEIFSK